MIRRLPGARIGYSPAREVSPQRPGPSAGMLALTLALSAGAHTPASAQSGGRPCTAPPPAPRSLSLRLTAAVPGPPGSSQPATPAILAVSWDAPRAADNPPTSYRIDAGATAGSDDVARVESEGLATRYLTPVPNGTWHVTVRARNDCGVGPASAGRSVRVRGSAEVGVPNPAVILETVQGLRETLGGTAFVQVTGQVRNGWGAAPASFVEVTASFDGPRGELPNTAAGFVNGASRRLGRSRIVTDTVLEAGAAGCFVLFTNVSQAQGQVSGLSLTARADQFALDALDGEVRVQTGPPQADDFGDLIVPAQVLNTGTRDTVLNEVWTELTGTEGRLVACRGTPVPGQTMTLGAGETTRTGLARGSRANVVARTEVELASARGLVQWVTWHETDDRALTAMTPEYQRLRRHLLSLFDDPAVSQREIAGARDALRRELRAIERRLAGATSP